MPLLANINVGTNPNDGTGDSLRDAFIIVNENFQFVEAFFPNTSNIALVANITSTGTSNFNIVNISGNVNSSASINATEFVGAGGKLTGVVAAYVSGNTQSNINALGTLTGLTLSGTLTGTTLQAATIGNTGSTLVGTLSTPGQTNITTVGNLTNLTVNGTVSILGSISTVGNITGNTAITVSNVQSVVYNVYNGANGGNVTSHTVQFLPNNSSRKLLEINSNITISYSSSVFVGLAHWAYIKNRSASVANIILPDTNNNLGTTVVRVNGGSVAYLEFTPFDATTGNVMVFVANN